MGATSATIAAENTFSESLVIKEQQFFVFDLSGTWEGTVHLQRRYPSGSGSWQDITDADGVVETWTVNVVTAGFEAIGADYRFGIKTGNYTSGSVVGRICTR